MLEKSVYHEACSPEMISNSFPVFCFWSRSFVPHGSEISRFWYIKKQGRKIDIPIFYTCYTYQYIGEV